MTWQIKLSTKAAAYFQGLPADRRQQVRQALQQLATAQDPAHAPQVKPLTGDLRGFHRLRVGRYRVIFSILRQELVIAVIKLAPRGDAYKG